MEPRGKLTEPDLSKGLTALRVTASLTIQSLNHNGGRKPPACWGRSRMWVGLRASSAGARFPKGSYLVDPASSHMLVSKIKPCMSKYKLLIL
jgi:hypothetical protein